MTFLHDDEALGMFAKRATVSAISAQLNQTRLRYGTYLNPFSVDSPWNLRPLDPQFGTYVIPTDTYSPAVQAGLYSTEFVYGKETDPPLTFLPTYGTTIKGPDNVSPGINTTYGTPSNLYSLTIPHMPAAFNVAAGTDGHIDIYDEPTGNIYSLWQAKKGVLTTYTVVDGGSGYTANSTTIPITVIGDGVDAAVRGTTNSSGVLTAITFQKRGANYTYATLVVGGTGSGAVVTVDVDTSWRCHQVNVAHIADTGWGDRGRYYKGARAAGVPTCGGLIRRHEISDGDYIFRHALCMSMTYSGLAPGPTPFIFPATASDTTFALNIGEIPEGALMMLPKTFNIEGLKNSILRKICRTLQIYGAYVVDRNTGTPFVIYVEGVDNWFNIKEYSSDKYYDGNGVVQSASIFGELDQIRAAMRQVVGQAGYLNANNNLLSALPDRIRMSNGISGGSASGTAGVTAYYDAMTDEVVITGVAGAWTITYTNPPNSALIGPNIKPFTTYKLVATTSTAVTVKPSVNVTGGGERIGQPAASNGVIGFFRTGQSITNQSISYSYTGTGAGAFRVRVEAVEVTNTEVGNYYPCWTSTPTISSATVGTPCTPTKSVTGSGTITYTYQWWISTGVGVSFTNISAGLGGTSENYTPQASDVGKLLCRTAVATGAGGVQAGATTNTVTVV